MKAWLMVMVLGAATAAVKTAPTPTASVAHDGGSVLAGELQHTVNITSQQFELHNKTHQAVFWGNVLAKRGTTDLRCNRMIAHYASQQEVNRIECLGKVEVLDGDRWAKGDHADFDNVTGVIVVTGNPIAGQGQTTMAGDKVTINLDDDTIHVDNVRAVLADQQKHERKNKKSKGASAPARDGGTAK